MDGQIIGSDTVTETDIVIIESNLPETTEVTNDYVGYLTARAIYHALWAGEIMDQKYYSSETRSRLLSERAKITTNAVSVIK